MRRLRQPQPATPWRERHTSRIGVGATVVAAAVVLAACGSSSNGNNTGATSSTTATSSSGGSGSTSSASLSETGSSLLYPVFSAWASAYHATFPNVTVNAVEASSGVGISSATAGTADIGASDAYLPPADASTYPGIENIPLAVSAQNVDYNLPTVPASTHLKLNGSVLAKMYTGKITSWNDPAIAALNPGVKLPSLAVHTVHRSDSSGDTFLFTSYLSAAASSDWTLGENTAITFPSIPNSQGALKNSGMLAACQQTPGCVAYIGISYLQKVQTAGLGQAALANKAGSFVESTPAAITAEATGCGSVPPSGTLSLIDCSSAATSYPIVNFEYAVVLPSKIGSKATAIKALLSWIVNPADGSASKFLSPVNFVPLPPAALSVSQALIAKV